MAREGHRIDLNEVYSVSLSDICDHFAILKFLWLHHGIYIYIDAAEAKHVSVGLAQACPNECFSINYLAIAS